MLNGSFQSSILLYHLYYCIITDTLTFKHLNVGQGGKYK